MKTKSSIFLILLLIFSIPSCRKAPKKPKTCDIHENTEDFFTIEANSNTINRSFNVFCKKVDVFGIIIYATKKVSDEHLLHTANIMAQYLDNNEDSIIDNQQVLNSMLANNACMTLYDKDKFCSEKRRHYNSLSKIDNPIFGQELYGNEIHPSFNLNNPFDATLEEVLHLVTHSGYSSAYPSVFGEYQGSQLADAMDIARGGQFTNIPSSYPLNAIYSYYDETCDYGCQVTEYFYWALTSILGVQSYPGRLDEIGNEWKANTATLVQSMNPTVYTLLTDTSYHLPNALPDGTYMR
jgi:hypothetical protein